MNTDGSMTGAVSLSSCVVWKRRSIQRWAEVRVKSQKFFSSPTASYSPPSSSTHCWRRKCERHVSNHKARHRALLMLMVCSFWLGHVCVGVHDYRFGIVNRNHAVKCFLEKFPCLHQLLPLTSTFHSSLRTRAPSIPNAIMFAFCRSRLEHIGLHNSNVIFLQRCTRGACTRYEIVDSGRIHFLYCRATNEGAAPHRISIIYSI